MRRFFALMFVILLADAATSPVFAQGHIRGTWYFSWSGIPFAKLWVDQTTKEERYSLTASFKSRGIVRMFKSVKSLTKSEGISRSDGSQTLWFDYENSAANKHTLLRFALNGTLTHRDVMPKDDPSYRPVVPAAQVKGAVTPGNILPSLGQLACKARAAHQNAFDAMFYEGRRLMQVHAALGDEREKAIGDARFRVFTLSLSRTAIGGFTQKELKKMADGEPAATLFMTTGTCFPVGLEVPVGIGTLTAYWQAEK